MNKHIARVRAIILHNDKVILIKREKKDELYWVFPGGGVELSDMNFEVALKRECKEELGINIEVGEFLIKQFFRGESESFYICRFESGELGTGNGPEYDGDSYYGGSHVVEMIDVSEIANINLKPVNIRDLVVEYLKEKV